jgi:hypothetical protein
MSQDRQWFVNMLRRLGYTEAAEEAERELPDPVPAGASLRPRYDPASQRPRS